MDGSSEYDRVYFQDLFDGGVNTINKMNHSNKVALGSSLHCSLKFSTSDPSN
jgi:hypothetical protein